MLIAILFFSFPFLSYYSCIFIDLGFKKNQVNSSFRTKIKKFGSVWIIVKICRGLKQFPVVFLTKEFPAAAASSLGSGCYLENMEALRGRFVFVGYWPHHMSIISALTSTWLVVADILKPPDMAMIKQWDEI